VYLNATPGGKYIYISGSSNETLIWETNKITNKPTYTIPVRGRPVIADNLTALVLSAKDSLEIWDLANSRKIFETPYMWSDPQAISSDGQYFIVSEGGLKLCRYVNNTFEVLWEESNLIKNYPYFIFDPVNPRYFLWDNDKNFYIKDLPDLSTEKSFIVDAEAIVNVDFYSERIMAYPAGGKSILIYDMKSGTLIKEIPADFQDLFSSTNMTRLVGNAIYNSNGIKYVLNDL
jgi:hypothetical protein